jgi:acyl-homoserine-lactone acylase
MKRLLLVLTLVTAACGSQEPAVSQQSAADPADVARWEQQAARVTIIRDTWGIAHIYGATDADVVFGTLYAQAEDDFKRVELNYINGMGRLAEAEGEDEIYRDLRMKLFIDPAELRQLYATAPDWLKTLMDAYADGLNYYLYKHPEVEPRVITQFEPWMALAFSEGSIGGDIERVNLRNLEAFYGSGDPAASLAAARERTASPASDPTRLTDPTDPIEREPTGSNGLAVAPANTVDGHAMLYINPHTSHYFRSELHMVSEEGLDAYGAVTWGQFFVYQGFNDRAGWMHTSSRADVIDEYLETVVQHDDGLYYAYGDEERELETSTLTIPYATPTGMAEKEFTVYHSHHGPIIRAEDGKWVAVKLMEEPVKAITQSFLRTKAKSHDEFRKTMELLTNSSNNTVYADADGNIAYYHGNFIPRRDRQFDWSRPVDGSDPATEWQGLHPVDEAITLLNPPNGWIQNTNNWPFSAAGPYSPKREDYPRYMSDNSENFRGLHAMRVLDGKSDFTLDSLVEAGFDTYEIGFEALIPALVSAYDGLPADDGLKTQLADQVAALRAWDLRTSVDSVPMALAMYWGTDLMDRVRPEFDPASFDGTIYDYMASDATARHRLEALASASETLESEFGSWQTPWGEINRFQRISSDIVQQFDDAAPSLPVAMGSGRWGALASYGSRQYPGTKRWYGTGGNSFVAAVEFGDRVRARAITAGGESGDPDSPHFDDQAERFVTGDLRDVWFYREDVEANAERQYRPGE